MIQHIIVGVIMVAVVATVVRNLMRITRSKSAGCSCSGCEAKDGCGCGASEESCGNQKDNNMKKGVIFDMDGVLVDNSAIHTEAFIIFCNQHGITMDDKALQPYFGMGNDEIIPGVFGREMEPAEIETLAQEKEAIYREIFEQRIAPMKGLIDTLEGLKTRGVKVAVGSSGMSKNVDFVLEKCAIADYFDAIANGDMISKAKPDPEVFLLAAKLLDLDPKDCVVFEDSFAGVKAARSAGMKVVALTTTYSREEHKDYDHIIDDFTQIDIDTILA